ncbi:MAG: HAD-IC family P-type ATPase [Alphaproteobacteria bacterium]|nr:HAD-IC family P-type ATPase [Alphaproteobacteria bacterium]
MPLTDVTEKQGIAVADCHALTADGCLSALGVTADGLATADAESRLAAAGRNILPKPPKPGLLILFLRQFKNPLVYVLLAASVVSIAVQEPLDAVFIFGVLLLNAVIGAAQEWHAQRKAEELDRLLPQRVRVKRDGRWIEINAETLAPGDLTAFESGDRISADIRLTDGQGLIVDESLLTGESTPVEKDAAGVLPASTPPPDRTNMLFAGTTALSGRAQGVVVQTGVNSQIGQIATALSAGEATAPPLLRRLEKFSRVIGVFTILLIAVVATMEALQGANLVDVFHVAVALAVSAIPEGLPIAITVALAVATNRMQRRNVIIRSLPAVEGLGACTLIASDKTGTLTRNRLTIRRAMLVGPDGAVTEVDVEGDGPQTPCRVVQEGGPAGAEAIAALKALSVSAVHCNEAALTISEDGVRTQGDPVDIAFLILAAQLGVDIGATRDAAQVIETTPYEPARRYASATVRNSPQSDVAIHVKGAGETLATMCDGVDQAALSGWIDSLASDGYRVIAVASGPADGAPVGERPPSGLRLLGLVGLIDPIRPEATEAIAKCRSAGVSVRMITGDHPETARAIARQLHLIDESASDDAVATQKDLAAVEDDPDQFDSFVESATVFARVEPVQKLRIVEALQRRGHVVAVTGDGVNDAPALNAADIGVAMGVSGTDVARGQADLILTDDNFASIVRGVEEGRIAYDNIRKLVHLLISTGLAEIVLFLITVLAGYPAPLFAVQLLWLNLVTNGIQHIALALEPGEKGVLERRPRGKDDALFDRLMTSQVLTAGCYMGTVGAAAYIWLLNQGVPVDEARNLILLLMVLFENAQALNARSERISVFRIPLTSNPFLILSVVGAHGLHIAALFTPGLSDVLRAQPVALVEWIVVAAIALSLIVVMDLFKLVVRRLEAARDGP